MMNQAYYIDKVVKLSSCWNQFAKEDVFNGISLADFDASAKACIDIRTEIVATQQKLDGLLASRLEVDLAANALSCKVVQGIIGHPNHGDNSPFYRALGYVLRNERSSGLVRPASEGTEEPPTAAAA